MFALKNHGRSQGRIDGWWNDSPKSRYHRRVIQRDAQGLGPQPLWHSRGVTNTGQEISVLDKAFALIEGHLRIS